MIRQQRITAALFLAAVLVGRLALGDAYDPPAGYYSEAMDTGATLKNQLTTIMSTGHILRTYGDFRYSAVIHDADPNVSGNILLVYNRASVPATWDPNPTALWNREHIWPDSRQPGNADNNAFGNIADPHALRPCNPAINTSRGNKAFGFETNTGTHGSVDANYYFPGDTDKGDVARQLFYSDTRWTSDGLSLTDALPSGFQMGDLSSLIAWHYLDVPDEFERRRNHAIYSSTLNPLYYTNNRSAFVDRPEFVWSVYVDQMNDSQITITGGTNDDNGGSTRNVDLGRVFVGAAVPAAQSFTLNKAGTDGTYYEVTTTGAATSTPSGRFNAFRTNQTDSKSISVGLNTNTTTAGLRSGAVTVNNLDITTGGCGGIGCGANDANDAFNVSLTVLDHASPSFANPLLTTSLSHNFGTVTTASAASSFNFDVFNLSATPGYTASMDFDSVMASGHASVLTTNAAASAGSLSLAAGMGHTFAAMMSTAAVGSFSATYTLKFSDEDLPGALNKSLTLTLLGQVILAGDYNRDGAVDGADYLIWRKSYGQPATAYGGADGNGGGTIEDGDYAVWQTHFGDTAAGGGSFASSAVPEPAGLFLAAIALLLGCLKRR